MQACVSDAGQQGEIRRKDIENKARVGQSLINFFS